MAQYLLMMILALSTDLATQYRNQLAHTWARQPDRILNLEGQQLGIIGFGGIARYLLPLVSTLGMTVVGISPSIIKSRSEKNAALWPMSKKDDLLRTSDHIVLSLPYIPGTPPILDAYALNLLKPTAFLYNVARSQLIDQFALIALLKHRRIAGAALDVFEHEPLSPDSELWDLPNVWITPHIAGHYRGLREASFRFFERNLALYRQSLPLLNEW
jgi:phosphoglycerate dehydrogenase-like enzyme